MYFSIVLKQRTAPTKDLSCYVHGSKSDRYYSYPDIGSLWDLLQKVGKQKANNQAVRIICQTATKEANKTIEGPKAHIGIWDNKSRKWLQIDSGEWHLAVPMTKEEAALGYQHKHTDKERLPLWDGRNLGSTRWPIQA